MIEISQKSPGPAVGSAQITDGKHCKGEVVTLKIAPTIDASTNATMYGSLLVLMRSYITTPAAKEMHFTVA